jgi:hypothetical protein
LNLSRGGDSGEYPTGCWLSHTSRHQSHVVQLRTIASKHRDFVQDASDDLRGTETMTISQENVEPLLTPRFAERVFRFRDSVGVRDEQVTPFELKGFRAELRALKKP